MDRNKINDNLYDMWNLVNQHKKLFEFWKKYQNMKNENDIRNRLEYLKKNPEIKQRTEIETLLWLLNEVE